MNTVLGLLAKGDRNCAGNEFTNDLFSQKKEPATHPATDQRQARQVSEIPAGVIRTEAEKQKAEEERRRQQEEEDRIRQAEEEAEKQRIAAEKRENSIFNKAFKGLKKFTKSIIEEDE